MSAEADWVSKILETCTRGGGLMLGVWDGEDLIGTIACRPLGRTVVGLSVSLARAFMIEGLCVSPKWRGKHLAGWLIAWVDHWMNQDGPNAFFWSRETPTPVLGTAISCTTYAYLRIPTLPTSGPVDIKSLALKDLKAMWDLSATSWAYEDASTVVPTTLDCKGLRAWIDTEGRIVLLADSQRRVRETGAPIYEVVWCGKSDREAIVLSCPTEEDRDWMRRMLEVLADRILPMDPTNGGGLLFATTALHQGGAQPSWSHPWTYGTSGCHATYIYNYMPPAFWNCRTILARAEI